MTHPEEERDYESERMPVTIESSGGETEVVKEAADKGETKIGEVVRNFIKRRKSYNIYFQLEFFISYEDMKYDSGSKCLN